MRNEWFSGTKGANSNFFHSALSQNIVCAIYKEEKTINEIVYFLGLFLLSENLAELASTEPLSLMAVISAVGGLFLHTIIQILFIQAGGNYITRE